MHAALCLWFKQYLFRIKYMGIYTMSCETGSDIKHKAFVKVISCSVSLLFVGSANWMAARNVALQIDIGHCKMHSALIMLIIMLLIHKNHRPQNLAS